MKTIYIPYMYGRYMGEGSYTHATIRLMILIGWIGADWENCSEVTVIHGIATDGYKLDRLGRSLRGIISLIELFQKDKILFISLTDNIDISTPGGKFQLHVFAAFAELERNIIADVQPGG